MTRVALFHAPDGRLSGFECRGHAGYAQAGSDIVCAAVSMLSYTCANALESVAGVQPDVAVREGLMQVSVPDEQLNHDALVILRTFEQGINDIASSYPKYIHITLR